MVSGAVLTGGASTRMGMDKAMLMAHVAVAALEAAGVREVVTIGGAAGELPDDHPGEGPLGAIITALRRAPDDAVVVLACDLPLIDGPTVAAVLAALGPGDDAAAPRGEPLCAVYRRSCLPTLERLFSEGERSPRRALAALRVATVDVPDPSRLTDADTPDQLP